MDMTKLRGNSHHQAMAPKSWKQYNIGVLTQKQFH